MTRYGPLTLSSHFGIIIAKRFVKMETTSSEKMENTENNIVFSDATTVLMNPSNSITNDSTSVPAYYYAPEHTYQEDDELITVLYTYFMPIFICIGLIGNGLSCYAVTRAPLKSSSISVYVFAYNISNIITLIFNSGLQWCFDMLQVTHFMNSSEVSCRIWQFVFRLMTYCGIWFVVCLSIDRYIAMWLPHLAQGMCNPFMAKIAIVCTFTGLTVVSCHSMWLYQFSHGWCYIDISRDANHELWLWVSGMLYSSVPLLIIFFFGNLLIIRFCLKHRGNLLPDSSDVDMDLTYFVMILSMLYFLFNFPATIIGIIRQAWQHDDTVVMKLNRAYFVSQFIAWINHSCPFFILLGCSKTFRTILSNIPEHILDSCYRCIRRRSENSELMSVEDNYVPVSNSSTSV